MSDMNNNQSRESGMSLIDVMGATIVGLVMMGAVLSLVVRQNHLRQTNSESIIAANAAYATLERIRSIPESSYASLDGTGFDVPGSNGQPGGLNPVKGDLDSLPGKITILVEESTGGVTLYRIIASVVWRGVNGRRTLNLQCLMGERK